MITLMAGAPDHLSRTNPSQRPPLRVGLVQHRWRPDSKELVTVLRVGIDRAAGEGAQVVFGPEITLLRYPADDGLGYNTAILVSPAGELVARTRKRHIPISAGYYEDTYFRPRPADGDPYPVYEPDGLGARIGMPTCWDEWFPEVARNYSLGGAEIVVYPTAIGSEPVFPAFDTQPLWQRVTFYGSSFISDPYGRVLVQALRDEEAVLVAELDLDQRRDWLELFPFLLTRRPDTNAALTAQVDAARPYGVGHEATSVVK